MSESGDESAAPAPRRSTAYQWLKHDVAHDLAQMSLLSFVAAGVDRFLRNTAWSNEDGSCTVPAKTLHLVCTKEGIDSKAVWKELQGSGRWRLTEDKLTIEAACLFHLRGRVDRIVEERTKAAHSAVAKRRAKAAPTKRARTRRTQSVPVEETRNTNGGGKVLSDNAFTNCSPIAHQKEGRKEGELHHSPPAPSVLDGEGGVVPAAPVGAAVSDAPASRADGAAAALTVVGSLPERNVPDWRQISCEERVAAAAPPAGWMQADVAQLVEVLAGADTGVDVERALYALCAEHQRARGSEAHRPLVNEVRSILDGAGGRAGLIPREHAPRAVALALHGANVTPTLVSPLRLRAIAATTLQLLANEADAGDPRRVAAGIAYEFESGRRKLAGFGVQEDAEQGASRVPERLLGHVVRQGAA
ncbi:MAG: hypothetical protein IT355_20630 [Gemmatimonadaceae bacterium]|nr:hypothetical protein [Gemmatimonadaceae bacterium]